MDGGPTDRAVAYVPNPLKIGSLEWSQAQIRFLSNLGVRCAETQSLGAFPLVRPVRRFHRKAALCAGLEMLDVWGKIE